jgi:hypothetical protein
MNRNQRVDISYTCRYKYRSNRHFIYISLVLTLDLTLSHRCVECNAHPPNQSNELCPMSIPNRLVSFPSTSHQPKLNKQSTNGVSLVSYLFVKCPISPGIRIKSCESPNNLDWAAIRHESSGSRFFVHDRRITAIVYCQMTKTMICNYLDMAKGRHFLRHADAKYDWSTCY